MTTVELHRFMERVRVNHNASCLWDVHAIIQTDGQTDRECLCCFYELETNGRFHFFYFLLLDL